MEPDQSPGRQRAVVLKELKRKAVSKSEGGTRRGRLGCQGPAAGVQETTLACFLEFSLILITGPPHGAVKCVHIRANL